MLYLPPVRGAKTSSVIVRKISNPSEAMANQGMTFSELSLVERVQLNPALHTSVVHIRVPRSAAQSKAFFVGIVASSILLTSLSLYLDIADAIPPARKISESEQSSVDERRFAGYLFFVLLGFLFCFCCWHRRFTLSETGVRTKGLSQSVFKVLTSMCR